MHEGGILSETFAFCTFRAPPKASAVEYIGLTMLTLMLGSGILAAIVPQAVLTRHGSMHPSWTETRWLSVPNL